MVCGVVLVWSDASELLAAEYCCCIEASCAAAWSLLCWALALAAASALLALSSVAWSWACVCWSAASLAWSELTFEVSAAQLGDGGVAPQSAVMVAWSAASVTLSWATAVWPALTRFCAAVTGGWAAPTDCALIACVSARLVCALLTEPRAEFTAFCADVRLCAV